MYLFCVPLLCRSSMNLPCNCLKACYTSVSGIICLVSKRKNQLLIWYNRVVEFIQVAIRYTIVSTLVDCLAMRSHVHQIAPIIPTSVAWHKPHSLSLSLSLSLYSSTRLHRVDGRQSNYALAPKWNSSANIYSRQSCVIQPLRHW